MLSKLQQYIVKASLGQKKISPTAFRKYYSNQNKPPSLTDQHNAVTRSVERLIERGYMTARGKRTPKKWFIEEVQLTPKGTQKAISLRSQQLPFTK